ncbi:MAG: winged helix-turn-helix transcriptional regulator [Cryobacterium sp.]|nr:winged helix-turn-helix transcriptional regulator [Cryobacterium sp.]
MDSESQIDVARIDAALAELRRLGRPQRRGVDRHRGREEHHHAPHRGEHSPIHDHRLHRGHPRLAGLARHRMLSVLAEHPGLGVTELAEAIGVDQPRASRLVQDAMDAGLLTRKPDPRDGRRSVVELSAAGRDHLERAVRERRESVESGLAGFSADDTRVFADLLERFVAALADRESP